MNDDDRDLRDAFARLREVEERTVPAFRLRAPRPRWNRLAFAASIVLMLIVAGFLARSRPDTPRTAASMSQWHAPTDFLLKTPGRELLVSVPQLRSSTPSLKSNGGRS